MEKLYFYAPLAIFLLGTILLAQNRPIGTAFATRSEVIAQHAMAATSHPLATQAALGILKSGGNAIDAAIAANAVLGLVNPPVVVSEGICLPLSGTQKQNDSTV